MTDTLEDERRWRWENYHAWKYWEARAQKAEAVVEAARQYAADLGSVEAGEVPSECEELHAALTAYDEPPKPAAPPKNPSYRFDKRGRVEPWTEQQLDSVRRLRP